MTRSTKSWLTSTLKGTACRLWFSIRSPGLEPNDRQPRCNFLPNASQVEVVDAAGHRIESQLLAMDSATNRARLLILADTPALGYKTYFVRFRALR